jgi:iron(II)-dependent oxidoreductase
MVLIPAGSFQMGCVPGDEACVSAEKPQHAVNVDAFYLDVDLVTVAKYQAFVSAVGANVTGFEGKSYATAPKTGTYMNWSVAGKEQHPINGVTWFQADAYCKWTHAKGRLPTEAEWEKAARGGKVDKVYPWGNEGPSCTAGQANTACYNAAGGGSDGYGCGNKGTCPVPFSAVNGYGLRDMAGNVWQWVGDWYGSAYYGTSPGADPTGPASGSFRVERGGYFDDGASGLRASRRGYGDPSYGAYYIGFRCARSLP